MNSTQNRERSDMEVKIIWDFLVQHSETIRNLVLIVGTPVAILLALMRSIIAQRQVKVTQAGLLSDRYQRAVEMLGHDFDSIHIGGIQILKNTALEHRCEYQQEVLTLLRAHYLVQKKSMTKDEHEENPSLKQQELAKAISEISREPADRWWSRLCLWLKNLCKRS